LLIGSPSVPKHSANGRPANHCRTAWHFGRYGNTG
jgi:hypothetical protein